MCINVPHTPCVEYGDGRFAVPNRGKDGRNFHVSMRTVRCHDVAMGISREFVAHVSTASVLVDVDVDADALL